MKKQSGGPERVEEMIITNGYRVAMFNPKGDAFLAFTKSEHNARFLKATPELLQAAKLAVSALAWAATHLEGNRVQFVEAGRALRVAIDQAEE